jgi:hypothetical protein
MRAAEPCSIQVEAQPLYRWFELEAIEQSVVEAGQAQQVDRHLVLAR